MAKVWAEDCACNEGVPCRHVWVLHTTWLSKSYWYHCLWLPSPLQRWASVSLTPMSNNTSDCGCHTPHSHRTATRAGINSHWIICFPHNWLSYHFLVDHIATQCMSPRASPTPLRPWITSPPLLQASDQRGPAPIAVGNKKLSDCHMKGDS